MKRKIKEHNKKMLKEYNKKKWKEYKKELKKWKEYKKKKRESNKILDKEIFEEYNKILDNKIKIILIENEYVIKKSTDYINNNQYYYVNYLTNLGNIYYCKYNNERFDSIKKLEYYNNKEIRSIQVLKRYFVYNL